MSRATGDARSAVPLAAVALAAATLIGAVLAGTACDLTERDRGGEAPSPAGRAPERASQEHESCARSADCAGDLRCFDAVCRRAALSVVGDLYTAVGDRALSAGRAAAAVEAYATALARYEQEKLDPPAALLCAHGGALAAQPGAENQALERAARLLHRCLNAAPPGSLLHQQALAALAGLVDLGLDPELLTRRDPVDLYLTKKPAAAAASGDRGAASGEGAAPGAGAVALEVPGAGVVAPAVIQIGLEGRTRSRSYRKLGEVLAANAELKAALAPCAKKYAEAAKKPLALRLPIQYGSAWDEDEVHLSSWVKLADAPAPTEPIAAEATTCGRAALAPVLDVEGKKLREETRWQAIAIITATPAAP